MDFSSVRTDTISRASQAARSGDLHSLRQLVEAAECEDDRSWLQVDNRGWTPLHHAAYHGHTELVKFLAELEAVNIDARTWEGETALLLACKNLPETRDVVYWLLRLSANVNLNTNEQCSSLQHAAVKTDLTVVRWLVRRGGRVNHSNVWGETALHTTMRKSGQERPERLEVVKYLLKHGARTVCCDENLLTPLMLAAQKGFSSICELLLTQGGETGERRVAHINMRAEDGATALMMAAQAGKLKTVEMLLDLGADPNLRADDGTYSVHLACIARNNSPEILQLLLPLTQTDKLREACNIQPPDYVPRYPDRKVLSPFKLAVEWENWNSLDVLVKHLDTEQFYTPLQFCFLHKDLCPDDRGFCDVFPYRLQNALSALLSERLSDSSVSKLHLLASNIRDPSSLPALVTLLTSTAVDIHKDSFGEEKLAGKAFSFLVNHGAVIEDQDLLPIFLFSSVSGVFRLITSGLVNPHVLVDDKFIVMTRNILSRNFSQATNHQVFELPLVAQRLLNIAIIATNCSLLESDWVQNLALLVLDQLKRILSIDNLIVIDKMYKDLRTPKSLQKLSRNVVLKNLQEKPLTAISKLNVPAQIVNYLLFRDVNVESMIKDYKETIDHINENGVSNIIHV